MPYVLGLSYQRSGDGLDARGQPTRKSNADHNVQAAGARAFEQRRGWLQPHGTSVNVPAIDCTHPKRPRKVTILAAAGAILSGETLSSEIRADESA